MSYIDTLERMQRLKELARRESTGDLNELADILGTSRSTTKRLVKLCRDSGVPISYCRHRKSYIISHNN
jgi:DNA-binding IclR family transcriptional regulator